MVKVLAPVLINHQIRNPASVKLISVFSGGSLEGGRTMSMFNEQTICMACKDAERKRGDYQKAVEADRHEIAAVNFNYKGIGLKER